VRGQEALADENPLVEEVKDEDQTEADPEAAASVAQRLKQPVEQRPAGGMTCVRLSSLPTLKRHGAYVVMELRPLHTGARGS